MTSNAAQTGSRRGARRPQPAARPDRASRPDRATRTARPDHTERDALAARDDPVGVALNRLQRTASTVRQHIEQAVLRQESLTWTAFAVLRLVWAGQRVETRQAAADAGIAKATLTGVVDALVARGLVRRVEHPQDRRLVLLELTASGRRLVRRVLPLVRAEEAFALASLDRGQVAELGDLLQRLGEHLRGEAALGRRS